MNIYLIGNPSTKNELIDKINFVYNEHIKISIVNPNKSLAMDWTDSILFVDLSTEGLIFDRLHKKFTEDGGLNIFFIGDNSKYGKTLPYAFTLKDIMALPFRYTNVVTETKAIIGNSQHTNRLRKNLGVISNNNSSILVSGESGVGKEVVSSAIHKLSDRKDEAFIAINCGAIPENLLESELFGYKKGSFTGAYSDHTGLFEKANNGTIFLDEIGELPIHMQSKLLRVLQERYINKIGCSKNIPINIRVISASNCNLQDMIKSNKFREDLYYRLNVIPLHILPLRERKDDIIELITHFLSDKIPGETHFSSQAIEYLLNYKWPGNVRELINVVERIAIVYNFSEISLDNIRELITGNIVDHFDEFSGIDEAYENPFLPNDNEYMEEMSISIPIRPINNNLKDSVAIYEKRLITVALEESDNNVSSASKSLGVKRTTLLEKIKRYSIVK